jgi:hypothetical protein
MKRTGETPILQKYKFDMANIAYDKIPLFADEER